eukprot:11353946-Alexandrium_andersonii.AAC.1
MATRWPSLEGQRSGTEKRGQTSEPLPRRSEDLEWMGHAWQTVVYVDTGLNSNKIRANRRCLKCMKICWQTCAEEKTDSEAGTVC